MLGQRGFWDLDECYELPGKAGDPLQKLDGVLSLGIVFRKPLAKALKRCDGAKGGRPPFGYGDEVQGAGPTGTVGSVG